MMTTDNRKLGLYVHIPFCIKKCAYCDFYSQSNYSLSDTYLTALYQEAEMMAERYANRLVDTVYIGGGTPSSLSADQLEQLLVTLGRLFRIADSAEVTLEANPATLDRDKLQVLKRCRLNRLSIGLQSANDAELKTLSRIHSFSDFEETYRLAREYISNISLDLMFGLPEQTEESFQKTLSKAIALSPDHISLYALKIEPETPFGRMMHTLSLPDDDAVSDMYLYACEMLEKNGYGQYEISNFARQGCSSRHNIRYWKREDYLGLGPSAHSFIDGKRFATEADIHVYTKSLLSGVLPPRSEAYTLSDKDILEEIIMLSLRTKQGLDLSYLEEKTGYAMEKTAGDKILFYIQNGFMIKDATRIFLTPKGFLVSNTIIADLLPD